jgi:hypothetical protein
LRTTSGRSVAIRYSVCIGSVRLITAPYRAAKYSALRWSHLSMLCLPLPSPRSGGRFLIRFWLGRPRRSPDGRACRVLAESRAARGLVVKHGGILAYEPHQRNHLHRAPGNSAGPDRPNGRKAQVGAPQIRAKSKKPTLKRTRAQRGTEPGRNGAERALDGA